MDDHPTKRDRARAASKGEIFDLPRVRARLGGLRGRQYWRCLEELADNPSFWRHAAREFPSSAPPDAFSRRDFLRLMGASLALAGLGACARRPAEKIVPYVRAPEEIVPGKPLFYATAMPLNGGAIGVLAESHMGRPTKIEGNPAHPSSLGATDIFAQASVLTLYDPDRSQTLSYRGHIRPWSAFVSELAPVLQEKRKKKGQGLRILSETVNSPTLAQQMGALLAAYPGARWHQYEPASRHNGRAGSLLAFGEYVDARYRFDQAQVVLALDADPLGADPGSVRYIRDFARRRRPHDEAAFIRLYAVECSPSNTGAAADHRLPLAPSQIELFARALASRLGVGGMEPQLPPPIERYRDWLEAVARDLKAHAGKSIVMAGERQPATVHALAHAINLALGNSGRTVIYTAPVEARPVDQIESLSALVGDMRAGNVDCLVMLGGNPVYNAPADLNFAEALSKVPLTIHLSLYHNETSYLCQWHIPEAHYLESWSDCRAEDGTVSIIQPLIAPLYGGKTAHEVVAALTGSPNRSSYEIVREYWRARFGAARFETLWERALHDGIVEGSALAPKPVRLVSGFKSRLSSPPPRQREAANPNPEALEIVFAPDPTIGDGRFANNGWLQELPKPLTKLTWENAALVSPATAERLGLKNDLLFSGRTVSVDLVEIAHQGRSVRAPVWIMPGHPDGAITVHLGYGRTRAGRVGTGNGFDAYRLRTTSSLWLGSGVEIGKTGQKHLLASTQTHFTMAGRDLVRAASFAAYRRDPHLALAHQAHEPKQDESLYPGFRYDGYAWGMAIDLSACVGCNACVVACQAENNIPVVGKEQVLRGREMHWLRVDRYYQGDPENPATSFQPVPCMHCENAPCEVVCPVAATAHSAEGLNDMVYNRCVGTRYCSNNCPYKVRRFNFLQYADWETPSLKPLRNPDVTVRSRGVMEKCTYCVQRINHAKIEAQKQGRKVRDGEIQTACQQACPAEAIVFGDINDPGSKVSSMKAEPRNYGILTELNTRPRTTYLARLTHPNPELQSGAKK
ncbi:MAG TPA: TAT-variant-translocated molybdopterin oxidoreductase [Candidatus Acidoferrales bacterium]|nr:TAT-variant-translocated molybdopterin oxidoreductase [Candidatus Acidoferrales bacterium]